MVGTTSSRYSIQRNSPSPDSISHALFIAEQTTEDELSLPFALQAIRQAGAFVNPFSPATDAEWLNDLCNSFLSK